MTEQTDLTTRRQLADDAAPDSERTEQLPPSTHRFPPYDATPGDNAYYGEPGGQRPTREQRAGRVTSGVLVAALVAGGLGGVAGAAGITAYDRFSGSGQVSSGPATFSTIVDRENTPPAEGTVEEVANSILPSVVKINVIGSRGQGSGSGVILSSDGEILTNDHVVEVAASGGSISVSFNDGTTARADIVGTDPLTDLAVIKARDVADLTPATLGRSGNLDVGEEVVAIGSPFGLEATVTSGIVSALDRPVSVGSSDSNTLDTTYPAIQTDAAINPGNSGGPLVNMQGEVVGINSSIRTTSSSAAEGGSIGLGFAIPLDKVLPIVDQLRANKAPTHARLGVSVANAASRDGLLTGAGISSIRGGSAADKAGLERGDVVTRVDDHIIVDSESLVATIRGYRPGDEVTLTVMRGNDDLTLTVVLESDRGSASP